MIDKSAVTAVFEALGPQRVARGLANADGHTWEGWRDRLREALTFVYPVSPISPVSPAGPVSPVSPAS